MLDWYKVADFRRSKYAVSLLHLDALGRTDTDSGFQPAVNRRKSDSMPSEKITPL